MRKLLTILTLTAMMMSSCNSSGQNAGRIRPAAVAGQFYAADKEQLWHDVKRCFEAAEHASAGQGTNGSTSGKDAVRAVIAPHAGYIFSGEVAASAFAQIAEDAAYEHIFLLGPSHHAGFDGASVNNAFDSYHTPLGDVPVDVELCIRLIEDNRCFTCIDSAHAREHCIEVQLPFLQFRLGRRMPPIVPVVIGTQRMDTLRQIAKALKPWFNDRNLFVISSDFSHYPPYADAQNVDHRTGEAILTGKVDKLTEVMEANDSLRIRNLATSACGQCAIAVLMLMMEDEPRLQFRHIMYRNSGDSPYGGKDQVVGYHSFVLGEEKDKGNKEKDTTRFTLNDAQKAALLRIARQSIMTRFDGSQPKAMDKMDEVLQTKTGAFVTLTKHGHLRGCIGLFRYDRPLCKVVEDMARDAAFGDPRFPSVTSGEMKDIRIEISVLTPLKRIRSIEEFDYGRQGIFIRKGYHSGTFLPQVADEVNWTKEEFLGHCARDKAGIGWDGWRNAELYTYEAIIFSEP